MYYFKNQSSTHVISYLEVVTSIHKSGVMGRKPLKTGAVSLRVQFSGTSITWSMKNQRHERTIATDNWEREKNGSDICCRQYEPVPLASSEKWK